MRCFPPTITKRHLQTSSLTTLLASIMAPNSNSSQPQEFTPIITSLPRSSYPAKITISPADLRRIDESPDTSFYSSPRFVQHIDDGCISRLKIYYGDAIRRAGQGRNQLAEQGKARVLDFCSSWTSHLSEDLRPDATDSPVESCVGIGMNDAELKANKHLTTRITRDLNSSPSLADIETESIDIAICSVSIDYMTRPVELLQEIKRVLRHGGTCHLSFSNRCFPTKVVGKWLRMDDEQRRKWVGGYFWACEGEGMRQNGEWKDVEEVILFEGGWEDPLFVVRATKSEKAGLQEDEKP